MNPRRAVLVRLGMPCVALLAACVPLVTRVYVPEVPPESLVRSPCAFNSHVPIGARIMIGSATAIVRLSVHAGQTFVEVHLEVPAETEIQLEGDSVSIAAAASGLNRPFRFPNVSLVDNPIVNSYSLSPALKAHQLPVLAPLTGTTVDAGSKLTGRHFWLATFVETDGAPKLFVTLPRMKVNSVSRDGPRLEFIQRLISGVALINC